MLGENEDQTIGHKLPGSPNKWPPQMAWCGRVTDMMNPWIVRCCIQVQGNANNWLRASSSQLQVPSAPNVARPPGWIGAACQPVAEGTLGWNPWNHPLVSGKDQNLLAASGNFYGYFGISTTSVNSGRALLEPISSKVSR